MGFLPRHVPFSISQSGSLPISLEPELMYGPRITCDDVSDPSFLISADVCLCEKCTVAPTIPAMMPTRPRPIVAFRIVAQLLSLFSFVLFFVLFLFSLILPLGISIFRIIDHNKKKSGVSSRHGTWGGWKREKLKCESIREWGKKKKK